MLRGLSLQILCMACITLTQSSQLSSRKKTSFETYDPFMICDHLGPTHSEGLPSRFSEDVYSELLSLCSSAHGAPSNVGCFCSSATSSVHCDPRLADHDLWTARFSPADSDLVRQFESLGFLPNGNMNFKQLCEHSCECVTADDADEWYQEHFDGNGDWASMIGVEGVNQATNRPPTRNPNHDGGGGGGKTFAAGSLIGHGKPFDHHGSGSGSGSAWQNQCGNNCSSSKDCSVPAGGGGDNGTATCTCQAHSSQYHPGSGTVAFIAACLVMLGSGSGGGKRAAEEGMPCPCNVSYVSHGCCDAVDGFVWELPEMRLGRLVDGGEL